MGSARPGDCRRSSEKCEKALGRKQERNPTRDLAGKEVMHEIVRPAYERGGHEVIGLLTRRGYSYETAEAIAESSDIEGRQERHST